MLNLLCALGTEQRSWGEHICLQQGLLGILSPLLRVAAQKKDSFQSLTARKRQGKVRPRRPLEGAQLQGHLDLQLSASGTVRQCISVVLYHSDLVIPYRSPRKLIHPAKCVRVCAYARTHTHTHTYNMRMGLAGFYFFLVHREGGRELPSHPLCSQRPGREFPQFSLSDKESEHREAKLV